MAKNPFEVLGLNVVIVRLLPDKALEEIAHNNFRKLQMEFHPDHSHGKAAANTAKGVNEAYSQLTASPEAFTQYKKTFIEQSGSARIADLEQRLQQEHAKAMQRGYKQHTQLVEYLEGAFFPSQQPTVFNIGPATIQVFDAGTIINVRGYTRNRDDNTFVNELEIGDNGRVVRKGRPGKLVPVENEQLIGTIPDAVVREHNGITPILALAQRIVTPNNAAQARLEGGGNYKPDYFKNRMLPDSFMRIMPLLIPGIGTSSYLFALRQDQEGVLYFTMEGKIQRIMKPNASTPERGM